MKSSTKHSFLLMGLFVLAVVIVTASRAEAQLHAYQKDGFGFWTDAENWFDDRLPNPGEIAFFRERMSDVNLASAGTINVSGLQFHDGGDSVFINDGDVSLYGGPSTQINIINGGWLYVLASNSSALGEQGDSRAYIYDAVIDAGRVLVKTDHQDNLGLLWLERTTVTADYFEASGPNSRLTFVDSTFTAQTASYSTVDSGSRLITENATIDTKLLLNGNWSVTGNTEMKGFVDGGGEIVTFPNAILNLNIPSGGDTIAHDISGEGGIRVSNGNYELFGSNSFSGGLHIDGGRVNVERGGNTGALSNTIYLNGGEFRLLSSSTLAVAAWQVNADSNFSVPAGVLAIVTGSVGGSAQLEKIGDGELRLEGNNASYTGEILVTGGTLVAGVSNSLGNDTTVTTTDGTTFKLAGAENWGSLRGAGTFDAGTSSAAVFESDVSTFAGTVKGANRFNMAGTGKMIFSGDLSQFTGELAASAGTLALQNGAIASFDGLADVGSNGTFEFDASTGNQVFNGTLLNLGKVIKTGDQNVIIVGGNASSIGDVEVAAGLLVIDKAHGNRLILSGGNVRTSAAITYQHLQVDEAGTVHNDTHDLMIQQSLTGDAPLNKAGSQDLYLLAGADTSAFQSMLNIQDGGVILATDLAAGHVSVGAGGSLNVTKSTITSIGSISGAGSIALPSAGLRVGSNDSDFAFAGDITGVGVFQKTGAGVFTFNGDASALGGYFEVLDGVLMGTGNIGMLSVLGNATYSPGESPAIGMLGELFVNSSATLEIEFYGASNPGIDYDRVDVSGMANISGTLDLRIGGGYVPVLGDEADIITFGSQTGTFATIINVPQAGNLGLAVRYGFDANQIDMRVSIRGDTDFDDDVDTGDLTTCIVNFTGGRGSGNIWTKGDFDGDGDTDTADLTTGIINFTGASAANSNVPDLIYDPATGNVTIDADGADVISFSLQSGPFSPADFSELPPGLSDNIASQIGWTSFNLFSGLTGSADLGNILPAGLNQAALEAALTTASYGLALSGGGGGGRLDIVIPEPATTGLLGLGILVVLRRDIVRM